MSLLRRTIGTASRAATRLREAASTVAPGLRDGAFLIVSGALLLAGGVAYLLGTFAHVGGAGGAANLLWTAATAVGLAYSSVTLLKALRRREPSVDLIAWLALLGALLVGEAFAGAVIAVMLATGATLEARASARAQRELGLLVARSPRTARRYGPDGVSEISIDEVARGDRLLVGSGEIVPVDARLMDEAVLDESALTGEPLPVTRVAGTGVRSGVVNTGQPVDVVATALAEESTYAGVVRLVRQAQASTAPFVRTADRFAVAFVPLTLVLSGLAWLFSGEAARAVAVLVVATPCPLLLAAPIAIMSGISRAARSGVVVKGGGVLERLAGGRVVLFDKTGTLTWGQTALAETITHWGDSDELLRLAASLEQTSAHPVAGALVAAARERKIPLSLPTQVEQEHGQGLQGMVDGHTVRAGRPTWVVGRAGPLPAWVRRARRRAALDGSLTAFVAVDGEPAGAFLFEDRVRPDAPRMVRALRAAGIQRVVMVTGDRTDIAETVGRVVGVDTVLAERDPAEKLAIVTAERGAGPVIMTGDGINDAPALAAADVGVALAARGVSASSEAADVVLTVDRIDSLADAMLIARRSRRIALQAVFVGMGLSLIAMLAAAVGLLVAAAGAVLQELIDVAAIGIALRAVLPGRRHTREMAPADVATARRLYEEHHAVRPLVERIRLVADDLIATAPAHGVLDPVYELVDRLERDLLPHERAEEAELLPIMAKALGGGDPTGAMSRTHAEIEHQISRLHHLLSDLGGPGQEAEMESEDILDLQRLLYGLYAILRLHNAQEEESAFSLVS